MADTPFTEIETALARAIVSTSDTDDTTHQWARKVLAELDRRGYVVVPGVPVVGVCR